MSLSVPIAAALAMFLGVIALTDDEIAQFVSLGCGINFYSSVSVTKGEDNVRAHFDTETSHRSVGFLRKKE